MKEEKWRKEMNAFLIELRLNRPESFRWLRNRIDHLAREYMLGDEVAASHESVERSVTKSQAESMSEFCNVLCVFKSNMNSSAMQSLLRCRPQEVVHINRLKLFVGMFIELHVRQVVADDWQYRLYKCGKVYAKGGHLIKQSNLSSTVYSVMRTYPSEDLQRLQEQIKELFSHEDRFEKQTS